jgi:hypothetical protein
LAALNGKIRFSEEGRITPFPDSSIPGITDVKSICLVNGEGSVAPFLFLTDCSIPSSTVPCRLPDGVILIIFEFLDIVKSLAGFIHTSPSVSWSTSI